MVKRKNADKYILDAIYKKITGVKLISTDLFQTFKPIVPEILKEAGFTNIRLIPKDEFPISPYTGNMINYGHVFADQDDQTFIIRIVSRRKFDGKDVRNHRYIYVPQSVQKLVFGSNYCKERPEKLFKTIADCYHAIPAWISISVDNSLFVPTFEVYFGTAEQLNWNFGIPMTEGDIESYNCLGQRYIFQEAVERSLSALKDTFDLGQASKIACDLLILIPIFEEFEYLKAVFNPSRIFNNDIFLYEAEDNESEYQILCLCLNGAGLTNATNITGKALEYVNPKLVVLLGIGGALDDNLSIGDVVVGDEVCEYFAEGKVIDLESADSYKITKAPKTWTTKKIYKEAITSFIDERKSISNWETDVKDFQSRIHNEQEIPLIVSVPNLILGDIASGNLVVASDRFKKELLDINRKFLIVEMEGAGVARVCSERTNPVDYLVIRCISDFADVDKSHLEKITKGLNRNIAITSASLLLKYFIQSDMFIDILTRSDLDI